MMYGHGSHAMLSLHTQVLALLRQECVSWRGAVRAIAPLSARCTGLCSVCQSTDATTCLLRNAGS